MRLLVLVVGLLDKDLLPAVGTKIRVKIEAPANSGSPISGQLPGIMILNNVSIGKQAGVDNNFATVTTPVEFLFGGQSGCSVQAGGTLLSDWLTFDMDEIVPYLVTFDYGSVAVTSNVRKVITGGAGYIISQGAIFNSITAGDILASSLSNTTHTALLVGIEIAVPQVLNTDIIAELSRDGGTTYSPSVLTRTADVTTGSISNYGIVSGDVDFTGDPSGTNMKARIKTVNNDKVTVKGIALNWS